MSANSSSYLQSNALRQSFPSTIYRKIVSLPKTIPIRSSSSSPTLVQRFHSPPKSTTVYSATTEFRLHASSASPPVYAVKPISPVELGLFSLLMVLTTIFGTAFCLAMISIPTTNAFRRLAISMDKLSKAVSEEVPGTLSSLKLSGLEINELTKLLANLRRKITGGQSRRKREK